MKTKVIYFRTTYFKLLKIQKHDLLWKDKYNTPRCEVPPSIYIHFLWWEIDIQKGNDKQWEQWLWVMKYNGGNITKAKETWPWVGGKDKKSTWIKYDNLIYFKKDYIFWRSW